MNQYLLTEEQRDCLQEITNVAMGQAGDRLARLLDVFVVLSIPHVSVLNPTDISMTLHSLNHDSDDQRVHGVCQGFIGGGIAGEAAGFAKILFVVFLIIAAVSLVLGRRTI